MFTAKVYNVMVGSLSGIMEEVTVAKDVIREWNQQNSERNGKVFLNVDWNSKIEAIQKVDVVIGLIGNWIENTEFVEECIKEGKRVILLFNAFQDPENTIDSEYDKVVSFKECVLGRCHCKLFRGTADFKQLLEKQLNLVSLMP